MAYSPQGEHGISREKAYDYKRPNILSKISEFFSAIGRGQTPFVTQADVEREKDRRATLGLDPDYYTNPFEDLGLMQAAPEVAAGREQRIKSRLDQIQSSERSRGGSREPSKPQEPDAATLALGSQLQLPKTGTNEDLVKMYAAQRSAGQYNMPEIQRMYMEQGRPDLAKWAAANPDLAQREYMKSIQKMGARPEGEELIEAYGGGEPKEGEEIIDAVNFLKKKAGLEK